jgi:hypothetical protein
MATDRTYIKDAEEAWITKYRAALTEIPVETSRSTKVRDALNRAYSVTISQIGRMLARSLDPGRWNESAQPSQPKPVSQATRNLAESSARVA